MSLNTVVLTGRLARDPELRYTPSGMAVTTVRLAVERTPTGQGGDRRTDFFDVVVWGKTAEAVAQTQARGRMVGVQGRLQSRSYQTQDGQQRHVVEVVAAQVQFLSPRGAGDGPSAAEPEGAGGGEPGAAW